ncbi:flagellar biosynthesis anti-sigma factor FlgM [Parasphingorhabdus sp.]|uniref:flagellar biosynthesis anti-sigma factor FlgM n=1 Tax=Parasphingorhabdus sp. TaxID=2709688 RepID=UPI003D2663F7
MKPKRKYSDIVRRLGLPGLDQAVVTTSNDGAGRQGRGLAETNCAGGRRRLAERRAACKQKVAEIRWQLASGIYHIDTDALASNMMEDGMFRTVPDKRVR